MIPKWFQNNPKTMPKLSQNDLKMIPKCSRNYLKMIPNCSRNYFKMVPKWSQNDPKIIPKLFQNDPNINPKWYQHESQMTSWAAHGPSRAHARALDSNKNTPETRYTPQNKVRSPTTRLVEGNLKKSTTACRINLLSLIQGWGGSLFQGGGG